MHLDNLPQLHANQYVTVQCTTTAQDIYYRGPGDGIGRTAMRRMDWHLREIPYTISGQFAFVKSTPAHSFIFVDITGQAAIVQNHKVVGYEVRTKRCRIPLSAIQWIKTPLDY